MKKWREGEWLGVPLPRQDPENGWAHRELLLKRAARAEAALEALRASVLSLSEAVERPDATLPALARSIRSVIINHIGGDMVLDIFTIVGQRGFADEVSRLLPLCRAMVGDNQLLRAVCNTPLSHLRRTRLMHAAKKGDLPRLRLLLSLNANPNATCSSPNGHFDLPTGALHFAARAGHQECALALLDAGAGVEGSPTSHAPLFHAFVGGGTAASPQPRLEMLQLLLERGAQPAGALRGVLELKGTPSILRALLLLVERGLSVNHAGANHPPLLLLAAAAGDLEALGALLAHRPNMRASHGPGCPVGTVQCHTPLQAALAWARDDMAALLLEAGAPADAGGPGPAPLATAFLGTGTRAAPAPKLPLMRLLLAHGAPPHRALQGLSPRIFCPLAFPACVEALGLLLESGLDLNAPPEGQELPMLAHAARQGWEGIVRALLSRGADPAVPWPPAAPGVASPTPLHHAVCAGSEGVVAALLAAGAPVDGLGRANSIGTPLRAALARLNLPIMRQLLAAGASAEAAVDGANSSAWKGVLDPSSPHLLRPIVAEALVALVEGGLDPEWLGNLFKRTPLWFALRARHEPSVRALLARGASLRVLGCKRTHCAVQEVLAARDLDMLRLLLRVRGAIACGFGQTGALLLLSVLERDDLELFQLLVAEGAAREARHTGTGDSVLALAVGCGAEKCLEWLLSARPAGVPVDVHAPSGRPPHPPFPPLARALQLDAGSEHKLQRQLQCVRALMAAGASPVQRFPGTKSGRAVYSPLLMAAARGNEKAVELLRSGGGCSAGEVREAGLVALWAGRKALSEALLQGASREEVLGTRVLGGALTPLTAALLAFPSVATLAAAWTAQVEWLLEGGSTATHFTTLALGHTEVYKVLGPFLSGVNKAGTSRAYAGAKRSRALPMPPPTHTLFSKPSPPLQPWSWQPV